MIYRCVLFDVGGTLWPDRWPQPSGNSSRESGQSRAARLRRVLPTLAPTHCEALLEHLHTSWTRDPPAGPLIQDTDQRIADALRHVAAGASVDASLVRALRRAMCVPASGRIDLFPGARELLLSVKDVGLSGGR